MNHGTNVTTLKIDPKLFEALNAIPDSRHATTKLEFTPEIDYLLWTFWGVKTQVEVAKIIGLPVNRLKTRYQTLKDSGYQPPSVAVNQ